MRSENGAVTMKSAGHWARAIFLPLLAVASTRGDETTPPAAGDKTGRNWTIFLAQDKHLDYGWCGSTTEIELRMIALTDYYLGLVEQTDARWNLDGTIWLEVYRRHRGDEGTRGCSRPSRKVASAMPATAQYYSGGY